MITVPWRVCSPISLLMQECECLSNISYISAESLSSAEPFTTKIITRSWKRRKNNHLINVSASLSSTDSPSPQFLIFNFNFTLSAAVNCYSAAQWGRFSLRNPDSTTVDTSKKHTPPNLSRFPLHSLTLHQLHPFSHFCMSGHMWTDWYLGQKSGLLDFDPFDCNRMDAKMTNSNIQIKKNTPF